VTVIQFVSECASTNADLAARLRAGEALREGDWLVADRQTHGKGRQGREWLDARGNFMGSTAIDLSGDLARGDGNTVGLSLLAGLAVYETVLSRLQQPSKLELKWPNDVLLAGAKLAGILLERHGTSVIVGIGVNLASAPRLADRKAVSLSDYGPAPDRDIFAADLAACFARELAMWRSSGSGQVLTRWEAAAHPRGTPLSVHGADAAVLSGTFEGLAADGALMLRLADGELRVIHAGDVSRKGD